eukprot:2662554-Rhodomonas_salina.1
MCIRDRGTRVPGYPGTRVRKEAFRTNEHVKSKHGRGSALRDKEFLLESPYSRPRWVRSERSRHPKLFQRRTKDPAVRIPRVR